MPIEKVPVSHRFGIIAQTHRLELQRRIAQQIEIENDQVPLDVSSDDATKLPFPQELDERFLIKFQDDNLSEYQRRELRLQAEAVIERCKRKCGLNQSDVRSHDSLHSAWNDLRCLSLCNDHTIQQASLIVLSSSLETVRLASENILSLVSMATDIISWISEFAVERPCLRENECIVIEIAEKLFQRLQCHRMLLQSEISDEFGEHLKMMQGIHLHLLSVYENHPLLLHQLSKAHLTISNLLNSNPIQSGIDPINSDQTNTKEMTGLSDSRELFRDAKISVRSPPAVTNWRGIQFHDESASIWHALDIWRSCHDHKASVECSVMEFLRCCTNFEAEERSYQMLSMEIIFEAAKLNLTVLKFMQRYIYDHISSAIVIDKRKDSCLTDNSQRTRTAESEATESTNDLPGDKNRADEGECFFFNGWSWLLIATCVRCLNIVFKWGISSVIQQEALLGENGKRAGLLHMLAFQLPTLKSDGDYVDWSWMIRHLTSHEMACSIQLLKDDPMKNGLKNIAWSALAKQQSNERDARVLEAYQVAIVTSNQQAKNNKLISRMCEIITETGKEQERSLNVETFDSMSMRCYQSKRKQNKCKVSVKLAKETCGAENSDNRDDKKVKGHGTKEAEVRDRSGWSKMQELARNHWLEDQTNW